MKSRLPIADCRLPIDQTLGDGQTHSHCAKRLECGVFTAAFA
jgi:hypothetical protein